MTHTPLPSDIYSAARALCISAGGAATVLTSDAACYRADARVAAGKGDDAVAANRETTARCLDSIVSAIRSDVAMLTRALQTCEPPTNVSEPWAWLEGSQT